MSKILFTSESVTEGHPDKICDQISDSILDALLEQDPMSRVACETAITTGLVLVMGEITSSATVDYQKIVRDTIKEIGYDDSEKGFDCSTCGVMIAMDKQSADIALGVDKALEAKLTDSEIGAGSAGQGADRFGIRRDPDLWLCGVYRSAEPLRRCIRGWRNEVLRGRKPTAGRNAVSPRRGP